MVQGWIKKIEGDDTEGLLDDIMGHTKGIKNLLKGVENDQE